VDETDSVVSPPQQWWSIQGYWAHAQQATRARWTVLAQAGLLGDTCTGLEARIPAQVLSYAPGVVVDLIGTNDVIAGATAATIIASDARRIATYRAAGIDAVVIGTIPPQNGNSAGKKSVIAAVNASRRDRARSTPGIYLWDVNSTLVDPATGEFRSDCQSDGTHPSVKGAALSGQLLGRVLNAIRSTPESDGTAGTATDTSQYLANPAMTGASTPPTGWSIYDIAGSSVYTQSLVARTDDLGGQFWQIAMTSGSLLIYQIVTMAAAGLAVGDPIYGLAEFETNAGATPTDFWMQIGHRDASTFYDYNYDFRTITSWAGAGAYLPRYGLFRTRRQPIAAGSDRIEVGFRMGGALTVRLGRTALVKGGVGR
jgi:lysophospholipase L1-like esterase